MSIRVIHGDEGSVLFCDLAKMAFGPVFEDGEDPDEFLDWIEQLYHDRGYRGTVDVRQFSERRLSELVDEWRREPAAQTAVLGIREDGEIVGG